MFDHLVLGLVWITCNFETPESVFLLWDYFLCYKSYPPCVKLKLYLNNYILSVSFITKEVCRIKIITQNKMLVFF